MADQKDVHASEDERTEWPHNPPLPPRELDPTGEGDALRSKAHPGDDTVFAANASQRRREEGRGKETRRDESASDEKKRKEEDPRPHIDR